MIVNFALLLLNIVVLKNKPSYAIFIGIVTFVYISFYLFYILEVYPTSPDLTYGSDARFYYLHALACVDEICDPNIPSVFFVNVIKSLFVDTMSSSHILVVVFNLQVLFLASLIANKVVGGRRFNRINLFLMCGAFFNPIVLWTAMRGLKEVSLVICIISVSYIFSYRRTYPFIFILSLMGLLYATEGLKPLGAVVVLMALFFVLVADKFGFLLALLATALVYIGFSFYANFLSDLGGVFYRLLAHREGYEANAAISFGFIDVLLAPLRFMFGPGPYRALLQVFEGGVFIVSSKVGDLLILIGAIAWWVVLVFVGLFGVAGKLSYKSLSDSSKFCLAFVVIYVITYSLIYFGTGDTRHRAVMYALLYPPFYEILMGARLRAR